MTTILGRPIIYRTQEEREGAARQYRRTWYNKNKQRVKENYNPNNAKIRRSKKIFKGYFLIYSEDRGEGYIGFSKDITARAKDILRNIPKKDGGHLYSRFDKNGDWYYKILCFCEVADDALLDSCVNDLKGITLI